MVGPVPLQVWLADLDALCTSLERAESRFSLLSAAERAWSGPLPADARRRRRSARIALRLLLDQWGAHDARGVELKLDGHGKPQLPSGACAFNVSHSGGLALYAIAARGPIGIDLETQRSVQLGGERRALIAAAGRAMRADFPEAWTAEATDDATFLSAWTCLEAFAKARGSGIGALLTELGITARGIRGRDAAGIGAQAARLRVATGLDVLALPMADGQYAALAAPALSMASEPVVRILGAETIG